MSNSKTSTTAAQLVLFEHEDRSQSHLIAMYDVAPRFVFPARGPSGRDEVAAGEVQTSKDHFVKSVHRDFVFQGRSYRLTLQPARIYRAPPKKDGDAAVPATAQDPSTMVEVEVFPGEREQIVEQVIRRLAMDRSRLSLAGENRDKVQMRFSLYEIKRELRAVNRTLDLTNIREALDVLARARIIISRGPDAGRKPGRGSNLLESTAFPVMAIRGRSDPAEEEETTEETFLEFNPLVSSAIRNLEFQPVSYRWLMKLKSPVSRWLYNRLSVEYGEASDIGALFACDVQPVTLTADEIVKYSGMNEWSRRRDTLRVVTAAVDALVEEGILDRVEKDFDKQGKRIDDITYIMTPSKEFMAQLRRAKQLEAANASVLQAIAGSGNRPDGFVPVSPTQATETRQRRVKRLSADENDAPLLRLGGQG
ncbi:plasmid replication protein [Azospirillum canadense]|uniref:plasmid replication protein n=1 Tax=Azospirillum canadense TaxID=403962 RepID=UPI002227A53B|nr:plasmid replication protein [Azospirillum canadense]MCW2240393.1 hypothetical protein [Azospirillum canadense]